MASYKGQNDRRDQVSNLGSQPLLADRGSYNPGVVTVVPRSRTFGGSSEGTRSHQRRENALSRPPLRGSVAANRSVGVSNADAYGYVPEHIRAGPSGVGSGQITETRDDVGYYGQQPHVDIRQTYMHMQHPTAVEPANAPGAASYHSLGHIEYQDCRGSRGERVPLAPGASDYPHGEPFQQPGHTNAGHYAAASLAHDATLAAAPSRLVTAIPRVQSQPPAEPTAVVSGSGMHAAWSRGDDILRAAPEHSSVSNSSSPRSYGPPAIPQASPSFRGFDSSLAAHRVPPTRSGASQVGGFDTWSVDYQFLRNNGKQAQNLQTRHASNALSTRRRRDAQYLSGTPLRNLQRLSPRHTPTASNSLYPKTEAQLDLAKKGRNRLTPSEQKQVNVVRQLGACVRCHRQKLKCEPDPDAANGQCRACLDAALSANLDTRFSSCIREKLPELTIYRRGGLNLMKDDDNRVRHIAGQPLPDGSRVIQVASDAHWNPIEIIVQPYEPKDGDITYRKWHKVVNGKLVPQYEELTHFEIVNDNYTAEYYERYISQNCIEAFMQQRLRPKRDENDFTYPKDDIVNDTHRMAVRHYMSLPDNVRESSSSREKPNAEKLLLGNLFKLWHLIRLTRGSSWICGEDKLDMEPINDPAYPLCGKVSVPRMIVHQYNRIAYETFLSRYSKTVLSNLDRLIQCNKKETWFTIYVCFFVLLAECSFLCKDRARHGRQNHGTKIRYSIPVFVERLQDSCNYMLVHWQYFNCHAFPDPEDEDGKDKHPFLKHVTPDQYELVMETYQHEEVQKQLLGWERYKKDGSVEQVTRIKEGDPSHSYEGDQNIFDWDNHFYWFAQLFEQNWVAHPIYRQEPIPKDP